MSDSLYLSIWAWFFFIRVNAKFEINQSQLLTHTSNIIFSLNVDVIATPIFFGCDSKRCVDLMKSIKFNLKVKRHIYNGLEIIIDVLDKCLLENAWNIFRNYTKRANERNESGKKYQHIFTDNINNIAWHRKKSSTHNCPYDNRATCALEWFSLSLHFLHCFSQK